MKANQATWPIATMARLLTVSSGFYVWLGRKPSTHARSDANLLSRIQAIHARSRGTCGMPRVYADWPTWTFMFGRKRVARLRGIAGLCGVSRRAGSPPRGASPIRGRPPIWYSGTKVFSPPLECELLKRSNFATHEKARVVLKICGTRSSVQE